ncbi:MAG: FixJ family two-component response regulator [Psychromonas sp.]|jgi:FixJ family two-component response regulator
MGGLPYGSAAEFLAYYNAKMCGCLILDMRIPCMIGLDLQKD